MEEGLATLAAIKRELKVPILSRCFMKPGQCERVAEVADVLQIPALTLPPDRFGPGSRENRPEW